MPNFSSVVIVLPSISLRLL